MPEVDEGRVAADLVLGPELLVRVEVHLSQLHWIAADVLSGREAERAVASSTKTGASFLQWPHQGV